MTNRFRFTTVPVIAVALCIGAALASQVRPVDLEEMTERSGRIFLGRCVRIEPMTDPTSGMPVTRITFEVERSAKGPRDGEVTVKLLAGSGSRQTALPEVRFREGEEYVLFLYPDSELGLTSPVGFAQGLFRVHRDKEGRRRVALGSPRVLSRSAARLGLSEADRTRGHVEPGRLLGWSERLLDAAHADDPGGRP